MKLCIPVERNEGLQSLVYGHFGSAPMFLLVDTDTREVSEIANRDLHHAHGACSPLKALAGAPVDAIVVGGIGAGALNGLNRAGLKVYRAQGPTVAENLAAFHLAALPELTPTQTCGGHAHGCSH
ncbi:MAG: NifB/NifX family molybdenum-iron cluster-binding protein [Desulfuromonadales bacterium]